MALTSGGGFGMDVLERRLTDAFCMLLAEPLVLTAADSNAVIALVANNHTAFERYHRHFSGLALVFGGINGQSMCTVKTVTDG